MDLDNRPTGWGGATVSPPDLTEIQAAAERLIMARNMQFSIAGRTPSVGLAVQEK